MYALLHGNDTWHLQSVCWRRMRLFYKTGVRPSTCASHILLSTITKKSPRLLLKSYIYYFVPSLTKCGYYSRPATNRLNHNFYPSLPPSLSPAVRPSRRLVEHHGPPARPEERVWGGRHRWHALPRRRMLQPLQGEGQRSQPHTFRVIISCSASVLYMYFRPLPSGCPVVAK